MRVIVAGLGAAGSMTAWQLAKRGCEVIALEQFHIGHDRGSSHGESRIVRSVYPDALFTGLMNRAFELWETFEAEEACLPSPISEVVGKLVERIGGLYVGDVASPNLQLAEVALQKAGSNFELLSASEIRARYPAFRVSSSERAILDTGMGYARPGAIVRSAVALAAAAGARVMENAPLRLWQETSNGVSVQLMTGETIEADQLILACGSWIQKALVHTGVHLPLKVTRQVYAHFQPREHGADACNAYLPGDFPVWIDADNNTYGFPLLSGETGVKLASHDLGSTTDPDSVKREVLPVELEAMVHAVTERLPGLDTVPSYAGVCLYTSTPTEDFVIDTLPEQCNVHVLSACSGHGFKFAPLIGAFGASLALRDGIAVPDRFRLAAHTTSPA